MDERLWQRVERELDLRRDPFESPELASALAIDPATERAVRRLVDRLHLLADAHAVPVAPPLRLRRSVLAAAALLVSTGLAFVAWRERARRTDPVAVRPRVETVSLIVQHTTPPPPRGSRVVLSPHPVTTWTLEGASR